MYQKEEIINLWFKMWIYKKDLGMENIFSQNIKYIESYGVKYENLLEVKRWFHEWNKNFKIDFLKEFACKLPQINPYR